jgi:hypothetical protein
VLNEVLSNWNQTIYRAKINCSGWINVADCYPRVFSFFDSLAGDYGVYHPYFSLKVRGEATEGTQRGLRREMVVAEPVIGKCLQAGCAAAAARLRRASIRLKKAPALGAFFFLRASIFSCGAVLFCGCSKQKRLRRKLGVIFSHHRLDTAGRDHNFTRNQLDPMLPCHRPLQLFHLCS